MVFFFFFFFGAHLERAASLLLGRTSKGQQGSGLEGQEGGDPGAQRFGRGVGC